MLIDWHQFGSRKAVFVTDQLDPPLTVCVFTDPDEDAGKAALTAARVAIYKLQNRRAGRPELGDRMRVGHFEGSVCYIDRKAKVLRLDTLGDQLLNWGLCKFVDGPPVHWNADGSVGPDICKTCNRELP